jgi:hypothetical protein
MVDLRREGLLELDPAEQVLATYRLEEGGVVRAHVLADRDDDLVV